MAGIKPGMTGMIVCDVSQNGTQGKESGRITQNQKPKNSEMLSHWLMTRNLRLLHWDSCGFLPATRLKNSCANASRMTQHNPINIE